MGYIGRPGIIPASVTLDGPVPSMRPRAGHPSGLPTAGIKLDRPAIATAFNSRIAAAKPAGAPTRSCCAGGDGAGPAATDSSKVTRTCYARHEHMNHTTACASRSEALRGRCTRAGDHSAEPGAQGPSACPASDGVDVSEGGDQDAWSDALWRWRPASSTHGW